MKKYLCAEKGTEHWFEAVKISDLIKHIDARIDELKPYVFCKCGKMLGGSFVGLMCPILRDKGGDIMEEREKLLNIHSPEKLGDEQQVGEYNGLIKLKEMLK